MLDQNRAVKRILNKYVATNHPYGVTRTETNFKRLLLECGGSPKDVNNFCYVEGLKLKDEIKQLVNLSVSRGYVDNLPVYEALKVLESEVLNILKVEDATVGGNNV